MIYIFATLIGIYLIFSFVLAIGTFRLPISQKTDREFPTVSVLLSCRNEEKDVQNCISSLENIDYPKEKVQVILIDDLSTDKTPHILNNAAEKNSNFEFYKSSEFPKNHLEAKARGIANAASKARGEWLFITDADCEVPKTWITHMLYGVDEQTGIITAAMDTMSPTFVGVLERIASIGRLLFGFGLAGYGLSAFALGPNMAIRKSIYDKAGGLEQADFRIAEDIALFNISRKQGYKTKYHFDEKTTVLTSPVENIKQLHSQQARWLIGGLEGERPDISLTLTVILIELMIFPLLVGFMYLFISDIILALQFLLVKGLSELVMAMTIIKRLKVKNFLRQLPIAIIYTFYLFTWLPLAPIFKKSAEWMGDGYTVKYE